MSTHTEDEQVITTLSTEEIIDQRENPIKTLRQSEAFQYMMLEYGAALKIVETKLHALDSEFNLRHDRNPIESISNLPTASLKKCIAAASPSPSKASRNLSPILPVRASSAPSSMTSTPSQI